MVKNAGPGIGEICIGSGAPCHQLGDLALPSEFLGLNLHFTKIEITIPASYVDEMVCVKHLAQGLAFGESSGKGSCRHYYD